MSGTSERINTTHVGSLPRPQEVVECLFAQDRGTDDPVHFEQVIARAVEDVVSKQSAIGIDVVSDGEMSKISYATYIRHRLNGFEIGEVPRATPQDLDDYPDYRDKIAAARATPKYLRPICKGPISVKTLEPVKRDIERLEGHLSVLRTERPATGAAQGFITAASPGTIAVFQPNEYYASHAAYLEALAEAMRAEYELIGRSSLLLSIDCPDLGMGRHIRFRDADDTEFLRNAELQIEALNHALAQVPAEKARLHVCWGNYEGPHTRDIALQKILPVLLKAKPAQLLIEAANPRHEHEWELWREMPLPQEKILVPGVLDTCCNFVEHPELIAQRLVRFAGLVGRDRILAGTDCGFGTFAGFGKVHPAICWAKLKALVEGAQLATQKLWPRRA